jgi:HEAT repeat protein
MGLGQPKNQVELQALVGTLADEDDNIRWLAGSSLAQLGGLAAVNTLAAFLDSKPAAAAETAARKTLSLIADMDADKTARESARKVMGLNYNEASSKND